MTLLEEAEQRYFDLSIEELLEELKKEKDHLELMQNAKEDNELFKVENDFDTELAVIWHNYKNYDQICDLIIDSIRHEIKVIKTYIKKKLEEGSYLDEEE